jgi:hypothetical protein
MRSRPVRGGASRWLAVEASAAGLAYGAGLLCTCSAAALRYLVAVPTTRCAAEERFSALDRFAR